MASYRYNQGCCTAKCPSAASGCTPQPSYRPSCCAPAQERPLAMAYVKIQQLGPTYPLCKGLQMGTIFPDLCKPFCGKRGGCR